VEKEGFSFISFQCLLLPNFARSVSRSKYVRSSGPSAFCFEVPFRFVLLLAVVSAGATDACFFMLGILAGDASVVLLAAAFLGDIKPFGLPRPRLGASPVLSAGVGFFFADAPAASALSMLSAALRLRADKLSGV